MVLEEIPGVLGSDYINASWINVRDNETLHLHFPLNYSGFQVSQCLHSSSRYNQVLSEAGNSLLILAVLCCAGPKRTTVGDFWRMVWQYKITHIVMVTGLCEDGKVNQCCYVASEEKELREKKLAYL